MIRYCLWHASITKTILMQKQTKNQSASLIMFSFNKKLVQDLKDMIFVQINLKQLKI